MTEDQLRATADLLWTCWQDGRLIDGVPSAVRPLTRQDGYAVQARLEKRSAFPLFGWKIAATSAVGQAHIAVTGPLAGRLLRERTCDAGGEIPFGRNHMRVAEAEFAFRMGRDLPPQDREYDVEQILDAVSTLHPAIEVPDSRFADFTSVGEAQLIADNACAHYFVLGAAAPDSWRSIDLAAHPVHGRVVEGEEREGRGANVLGDPRIALAWLVNELSSLGIPLREGQVVTTGTCLTPLSIRAHAHVVADFGPLGQVAARLGA